MKHSLISRSLIIAGISVVAASAHAAGTWMEARGDAMGGTGVASSHYGAAALVNPARLTKFDKSDDFSLILPAVGAQVSDPDNLQDGSTVSTMTGRRLKARLTQVAIPAWRPPDYVHHCKTSQVAMRRRMPVRQRSQQSPTAFCLLPLWPRDGEQQRSKRL